ncbi:hypothetical protein QTP88_001612 [Uroleucon formosanum]
MSSKPKCLSISDKKKIIEEIESGKKKKEVTDSFKIPFSSLSTILKQKEAILNTTDTQSSRIKRRLIRQQNILLSGILIKEKAKSYAEMFGISDFNASDGWLSNFKKRHNFVVDEDICKIYWQMKLQDLLYEYDPKNVFNADETGLFFKCLSNRTLTKERVTLLFAVNMDGSEKLRHLFIGKSANPRCFKNVKSLPVTYKNNKKSWMTTKLWNEWLETLNNDMRKQHRKIIIFVDNCAAHNNPPTLSNVRIEFLPANTTSKLQPLDQGIIKNFKLLYRKEIVSEFLACLDNNDSPKVTVLTAIIISHKAWNNMTTQTIQNCFRKCGFVKTIDNEEEEFPITLEVDTQHNTLSTVLNDQLTFEDYVAIDDDLAVCGFNNEEGYDEENDEEESPEDPIVNSKEAKLGLRAVLGYLQRHDIDDNVFSSILNLDNTIDKLSVCSGTKGGNKSKLNKLNAHAKSNLHLTCMVKWSAYQKTKETGNFKELCKLLEKSNEEFGKKCNLKTNYTSHIIQDELINICADVVKEIIVKDIEDVEVFGIMCDEARCYKQEQMALCVRYVKNLDVVERFLGFIDCSKNQDAKCLYQYILWYLKKCKLSSKPQIVAQSYDGANVMSGILTNLKSGRFIVYLFILHKVLINIKIVANKFQEKTATLEESKNIIQGVMMTFKNSRTTEYFSKLWCEIEIFAKDNEISIQTPSQGCKRKRQEPHNLKHFDTTATTSAEQNINDTSETIENYFRKNAFFPVFDTILINLEKRFSAESLQMATAVDQFIQLNFEESLFFVDHYKDLMNVSKEVLQSEIEVAKNCILQSTDKKI